MKIREQELREWYYERIGFTPEDKEWYEPFVFTNDDILLEIKEAMEEVLKINVGK